MAGPVWAAPCPVTSVSGHVTCEPAPLLLREAAPNAVPLAVLQRPCQAELSDRTDATVGQGGARLLFRCGEEDVRVDAVTGGPLLPHVGWGRVRGKALQVDTGA